MKIIIREKKYYIKKPKGWNPCILGYEKARDKELNVLPNCVGWAVGRFNELGKQGDCKYLGNTNAENFIKYCKTQNLTLSQYPKKGACMCWQGKGSLAGHVAIVEEVISPTQVITSESGYGNYKNSYWSKTRSKGKGNWEQNSKFTFSGFILNPVEIPEMEWTPGDYILLAQKTIRTSCSLIPTNRVKVKQCRPDVKPKLTSKRPNDIAEFKSGVMVHITEVIPDGNRLWGKLENCYIVIRNADGTPQAYKE